MSDSPDTLHLAGIRRSFVQGGAQIEVLQGVDLRLAPGTLAALVGPSGAGKSTLLRLVRGDAAIDGGSIQVRTRARVGEVAQEAPGGDRPVLDTVLAADRERTELLAEAETASDPHRVAEIHTRLADIGAHAAPARAAAILSGRQCSNSEWLTCPSNAGAAPTCCKSRIS